MRNKTIVVIVLFILVVVGIYIFYPSDNVKSVDTNDLEEETEEIITKIKVDIKGAIKSPGVYEVDSDKRVTDVIKLAGGTLKGANTNYINLSAKVKDEMVIWIYTSKEIKELQLEQESTKYMIKECNCPVVDNTTCLTNTTTSGKVNINKAGIEELMTLEGIGESKAKTIIEYRTSKGVFRKIEDIKNVTGIGESAFDKIKNNITV